MRPFVSQSLNLNSHLVLLPPGELRHEARHLRWPRGLRDLPAGEGRPGLGLHGLALRHPLAVSRPELSAEKLYHEKPLNVK